MKIRVRSRRLQPKKKFKKIVLLTILIILLLITTSVAIIAGGNDPTEIIDHSQVQLQPTSIPEPDSLVLMGIGLVILISRFRK